MPELDILYMTRVQQERFDDIEEYLRLRDAYILTPEKLVPAKKDLIVLHPLPRVNEISVAIDEDPRACYFKQVRNGKYMRMALILKLIREAEADPVRVQKYTEGDFVYIPDVRSGIAAGKETFAAKVIRASGEIEDITLYVKGLTENEKEIILRGCLMNYYAAQSK